MNLPSLLTTGIIKAQSWLVFIKKYGWKYNGCLYYDCSDSHPNCNMFLSRIALVANPHVSCDNNLILN